MARILVVDDEESIRLSLRQFLAYAGYEADSAEAVDEAMGMLAAEEFDVVVSDIIMPRLTGVALLDAIKETSPEVEVILMTGEPTVDTASQAVRSGAFDYLAKPIGKDEFLKTVANAVRVKDLGDERRRLAEENRQYQDNLEELIQTRTKALYDSEERMTLALQGADLATWDWDVKTDSIIRNKRWSEMLGYEEGEIDESLELFTDLVHPDDRQFSWDTLDVHLEGKTDSFEVEHRMRHKSGGWVWVLDRGRVLEWDLDGKPLRICGTHLDITARREAEQQLKKLNKAKDELIAGVSHELRTPLTAVLGLAQELTHGWETFTDEETQEIVALIAGQSTKLSHVIEDLMVAARTDNLAIFTERLDLRAEVELQVSTLDDHEGRRIEILGPEVQAQGDPFRVRQILRNLLNNAVRHGGEHIEVEVGSRDGVSFVDVQDDGTEISSSEQEDIFHAYHHGLGEASQPPSVGLGLTLSRQLARLMDGDLTYRYEKARSIFEFTIPRAENTGDEASE